MTSKLNLKRISKNSQNVASVNMTSSKVKVSLSFSSASTACALIAFREPFYKLKLNIHSKFSARMINAPHNSWKRTCWARERRTLRRSADWMSTLMWHYSSILRGLRRIGTLTSMSIPPRPRNLNLRNFNIQHRRQQPSCMQRKRNTTMLNVPFAPCTFQMITLLSY